MNLTLDDLSFEVRYSTQRKTIGITVERDGSLVVTAPADCSEQKIRSLVECKLIWVYTKLAEKGLLYRPATTKEFVNGEGFYYLGRSYRLLLVNEAASEQPPLRLVGYRFLMRRDCLDKARSHFISWYVDNGQRWLEQKVSLFASALQVAPSGVTVRDLGYRWGSCSADGTLNFHWCSVLLPMRFVEYIVVHEMVHLHEPQHTRAFWHMIAQFMPDFADRRQWIGENGGHYLF